MIYRYIWLKILSRFRMGGKLRWVSMSILGLELNVSLALPLKLLDPSLTHQFFYLMDVDVNGH